MKKIFLPIIFIIFFAGIQDLLSQTLMEAEVNPEYLNYLDLKNIIRVDIIRVCMGAGGIA